MLLTFADVRGGNGRRNGRTLIPCRLTNVVRDLLDGDLWDTAPPTYAGLRRCFRSSDLVHRAMPSERCAVRAKTWAQSDKGFRTAGLFLRRRRPTCATLPGGPFGGPCNRS